MVMTGYDAGIYTLFMADLRAWEVYYVSEGRRVRVE
jgi:hypothetical protein